LNVREQHHENISLNIVKGALLAHLLTTSKFSPRRLLLPDPPFYYIIMLGYCWLLS
jgi:hypothetical protein